MSRLNVTDPGKLASDHFPVPTILDSASNMSPDSSSDPQRDPQQGEAGAIQ